MRYIVIDKSWLQGASIAEVEEIAFNNRLLMPAVLGYELFKTIDEATTAICFRKLLKVQESVDLMEHVGSFLVFESESNLPCTPIQNRKLPIVFEFNPRLTEANFPFTEEQKASLEYFRNEWENHDIESFKELAARVTHWFPEIEGLKAGGDYKSIQPAIDSLTQNSAKVYEIYEKLHQTRKEFFPRPEIVDESWAFFRWIQVSLIYALEYTRKYGAGNVAAVSKSLPKDRLDRQYLITGILAKAIATEDKDIKRYFGLCCPEGYLV